MSAASTIPLDSIKELRPLDKLRLHPWQRNVVQWYLMLAAYGETNTHSRGLIIKHGLGSGKTRTALAAAIATRAYHAARQIRKRIVLFVPASLVVQPWVRELRVCFPTLSAKHSDYTGFLRALESQEDVYVLHSNNYTHMREDFVNLESKLQTANLFNESFVILDEAQNMINTLREDYKDNRDLDARKQKNVDANAGGTYVREVYRRLVSAINCNVAILSGTPVGNDVIEACYYANVLKGSEIFQVGVGREDTYAGFHSGFFIEVGGAMMIRPDRESILVDALAGLVSYYKGKQPKPGQQVADDGEDNMDEKKAEVDDGAGPPEKRRTIKLHVAMGPSQASVYMKLNAQSAQELKGESSEINATKQTLRRAKIVGIRGQLRQDLGIKTMARAQTTSGYKYITAMRQIGNVFWDSRHYTNVPIMSSSETVKAAYNEYSPELQSAREFMHPKKYSPKTYQILKRGEAEDTPVAIYSNFNGVHGVGYVAGVLRFGGLAKETTAEPSEQAVRRVLAYLSKREPECPAKFSAYAAMPAGPMRDKIRAIALGCWFEEYRRGDMADPELRAKLDAGIRFYSKWSGDTNNEERRAITERFNHPDNKEGKLIKYILITAAGREGVEFHNCRQIHIMEPQWNLASDIQIIGRVVRIGSHRLLSSANRFVQPYLYMSTLSSREQRLNPSIDEIIHNVIVRRKQAKIEPVNALMHACAIDAVANREVNGVVGVPLDGIRLIDTNPSALSARIQSVIDVSKGNEIPPSMSEVVVAMPEGERKVWINDNDVWEYVNGVLTHVGELINGQFLRKMTLASVQPPVVIPEPLPAINEEDEASAVRRTSATQQSAAQRLTDEPNMLLD